MDVHNTEYHTPPIEFSACNLFGLPDLVSSFVAGTDTGQLAKVADTLKHGRAHQNHERQSDGSPSGKRWYLKEGVSIQYMLDGTFPGLVCLVMTLTRLSTVCFEEFYE